MSDALLYVSFVENIKTGWFHFFAIFSIVFALSYISLVRFFTVKKVPSGVPKGLEHLAKKESKVENKPFIILISMSIAFLVAATAIQTNFLILLDSSYGYMASLVILLVVCIVLLIPFYKFLDKNISNRIFTNLISFGIIWIPFFMIKHNASSLGNIPQSLFLVINIIGGEPFLILGIIFSIIAGSYLKK